MNAMRPVARRGAQGYRPQSGIILLFALVALALLLIGTAALLRSGGNTMFAAGNFGFKRDLTNQAERAVAAVLTQMQGTGALSAETSRQVSAPAQNYSAVLLPNNAQGVPNALLTDAAFGTVGLVGNDIVQADQGVTVRYVIDRMCTTVGPADAGRCTLGDDKVPQGASHSEMLNAMDGSSGGVGAVTPQVVYRISIRVTGPRGTQSFFQTTFTA